MTARTTLLAALIASLALNLYLYSVGGVGGAARTDREIVDDFHRLFVESKQIFSERWFGIETWQHPFDVWMTQEIIWEVRPDVIVETGTLRGGSAALWAFDPRAREPRRARHHDRHP